jgi:hypothetical protein
VIFMLAVIASRFIDFYTNGIPNRAFPLFDASGPQPASEALWVDGEIACCC